MKLAIWALAAALLVPSLAAADRGDRRAERRARILEHFDANQDGRLDREERQVAKAFRRAKRAERRMQRFVERFDRNHDGNVGPGEAPPEAMRRMRRLDRDGDGWVRPDEQRPRRDRFRRHDRVDPRSHADGRIDPRTPDDVPNGAPGNTMPVEP